MTTLEDDEANIFCREGRLKCDLCGAELFKSMQYFKMHLNSHKYEKEFKDRLAQYKQQKDVAHLAIQQQKRPNRQPHVSTPTSSIISTFTVDLSEFGPQQNQNVVAKVRDNKILVTGINHPDQEEPYEFEVSVDANILASAQAMGLERINITNQMLGHGEGGDFLTIGFNVVSADIGQQQPATSFGQL